jgi:hypothetical protein
MPQAAEIRVYGLDRLMRDLRKLPAEAQQELRDASAEIAGGPMYEAWHGAAMKAGPWGPRIAESIRVKKSDRIPSIQIGAARRVFSGGASASNVRFPSSEGSSGRGGRGTFRGTKKLANRERRGHGFPAAFGSGTGWIKDMKRYKPAALREWMKAVDRIKAKFERG